MLAGAMLLWFILTAFSLAFVAIDIRRTPESAVLKWGFVILTLFTGPVGAFFYVLGCREPLPGTHEAYVAATWRQVLGSTMHCAAGDGLGIIAGAAIASFLQLGEVSGLILEYTLGFSFGWGYFQAYAMRDMADGSYRRSLKMTFIPELYSMNVLMVGMQLVAKPWMQQVPGADDPLGPSFWFVMSMALLAGFLCAYPMNWWLVTRNLKHGMMTIRAAAAAAGGGHAGHSGAPSPTQMQDSGGEHGGGHGAGHGGGHAAGHGGGHAAGHGGGHEREPQAAGSPSAGSVFAVGALSFALFGASLVVLFLLRA